MQQNAKGFDSKVGEPVLADREVLLRDLNALPGNKILDRILEQEDPRKMVQSLSSGDFFSGDFLFRRVNFTAMFF